MLPGSQCFRTSSDSWQPKLAEFSCRTGYADHVATSSVNPQFIPSIARLRALEAAIFSRGEQEAAKLAGDFVDSGACESIAAARDEFAAAAAEVDTKTEAGDIRTADASVDALRTAVAGHDRQEELLSLHIALGFAVDAVTLLLGARAELSGTEAEPTASERIASAQESLAAAFDALFADDTLLDDRLAMWGRRVAGDCAVWARTLLGLESDETKPEADETVEWLVSHCFSEHSRRMNKLKLAA